MTNGQEPVFQLDSCTLGYEARGGSMPVLENISLTIFKGEKVVVMGASGSGKSTLLKHLRLQTNNAAWCPQNPGLVPMLSVFHNIYAGTLDQHNLLYNLLNLVAPQKKQLTAINAVLNKLELDDGYIRTAVESLSGGQQQRVGLGRALIQHKSVFLGDEPVSAVDEFQARALIRLVSESFSTTVIALHDIELALSYASRVVGLKDGRIVIDAQAEEVSAEQVITLYG